jgi:guanine nucleotide-binding protein G(i) subunit alpha
MSSNMDAEESRKRSQIIDRGLEEDARRLRRECKILLLGRQRRPPRRPRNGLANVWEGSGESGKSTIVKQMKIIHQNGYTVDELALYRLTIYKNLTDCAKALIGAMRQFDIEPQNPENVEYSDFLLDYQVDPDPHTPLGRKVGIGITSLWKDPAMEQLLERQSEFYLMDSAP